MFQANKGTTLHYVCTGKVTFSDSGTPRLSATAGTGAVSSAAPTAARMRGLAHWISSKDTSGGHPSAAVVLR